VDAPITQFDEHGLGQEPNNLAAIGSLKGYRALRWGQNVELIVTDQRSYRSEEPTEQPEANVFSTDDFPEFLPQEAMEILDAGRTYDGGKPPTTIRFGSADVPKFCKDRPAQTILGADQKAWFLERLKSSTATWKIWGNTTTTLDMRADPQNLPHVERGEIYDLVEAHGITGFVTVAGDRHSFWAGLAAKALPPHRFAPVGLAFVTGSISAPGMVEALEHRLPKDHPLRALFLGQGPGEAGPQPTMNMLLRHGVRSCLEYARSGDIAKARALSNRDLSPHVEFVDMGGHGYSVVRATRDSIETEFVCIPRPIERSERPDGGPLSYRVRFRTPLWEKGKAPQINIEIVEGEPRFSV
jgi:alkaline phosphatase D